MTKQEFLKTIPALKVISPIFSQVTKMPMVFCHEETMDDYIYVYLEAEEAKAKAQALCEEKRPAFVVNCKEKEVLAFLAELRLTGVNAICFVTAKAQGGEEFIVQLTEFLRIPDWRDVPAQKRPVENTSLQLSMLYFMQEVRRPTAREDKQNLAELEEETSVNLTRGKFMLPIKEEITEEGQNKKGVLMLKNEKDEVLIPLCTDAVEMRKFMKGKPCPVVVTEFKAVVNMLQQSKAAAVVVNPASCNLILVKPAVDSVVKRFLE